MFLDGSNGFELCQEKTEQQSMGYKNAWNTTKITETDEPIHRLR